MKRGGWIWEFDFITQCLMYPSSVMPSSSFMCANVHAFFSLFPLPPSLACSFFERLTATVWREAYREIHTFFFFFLSYIRNQVISWEARAFAQQGPVQIWIWILYKRFLYTVVVKNQITWVSTEPVNYLEIMLRVITLPAVTQKTFI